MKTDLIDNITDYIDYLRSSLKLQVSLCNISNYYGRYMHVLYPYNYHDNAFCNYVKSMPNAMTNCVSKQNTVIQKCSNGAFYGSCWAGMEEFVFPINYDDNVVGFVSVSGYRNKMQNSQLKLTAFANRYGIDEQTLHRRYTNATTDKVPDAKIISTLVNPLCLMLGQLYGICYKQHISTNPSLYEKILDYVCSSYMQHDVSLDSIANSLNYSKSYVRQVFCKNSGQSIGEYLMALRIKNAKRLLTATKMPIGEVAYAVGYTDANHFSAIFKKKVGASPKQFRHDNDKYHQQKEL